MIVDGTTMFTRRFTTYDERRIIAYRLIFTDNLLRYRRIAIGTSAEGGFVDCWRSVAFCLFAAQKRKVRKFDASFPCACTFAIREGLKNS